MATLTAEQIEQKKQQLKQLSEEMNAIVKELQEAGEWPLDEDDLDQVAGGRRPADVWIAVQQPNRPDDSSADTYKGPPPGSEAYERMMKTFGK